MNDQEALAEISRIAVETCEQLLEIYQRMGRRPPTTEELLEAVRHGVLSPNLQADGRPPIVALVETLCEDLLAARLAGMLNPPD